MGEGGGGECPPPSQSMPSQAPPPPHTDQHVVYQRISLKIEAIFRNTCCTFTLYPSTYVIRYLSLLWYDSELFWGQWAFKGQIKTKIEHALPVLASLYFTSSLVFGQKKEFLMTSTFNALYSIYIFKHLLKGFGSLGLKVYLTRSMRSWLNCSNILWDAAGIELGKLTCKGKSWW